MGVCASASGMPMEERTRQVELTLVRDQPDMPLGLTLIQDRKGVLVYGVVAGGLVARHNAENPLREVCRGDRILSINGLEVGGEWNGWFTVHAEIQMSSVHLVLSKALGPRTDATVNVPLLAESIESVLVDPSAEQVEACKDETCAICLDALQGEEKRNLAALPCGHCFHRACAERWLSTCPKGRQARCPTCIRPVFPDAAESAEQQEVV